MNHQLFALDKPRAGARNFTDRQTDRQTDSVSLRCFAAHNFRTSVPRAHRVHGFSVGTVRPFRAFLERGWRAAH